MTLIGAFELSDVVLFADRQESISDYAKWDANKISYFESIGAYRVVMAGAGDSEFIDMIWEQFLGVAKMQNLPGARGVKELVLRTVSRITRKCILPYPRNDRPWVDLIWAIQQTSQHPAGMEDLTWGIDLFHTQGLAVNQIRNRYFSGNPRLLVQYLSDAFLDGLIIGTEEAEALAVYLLWEAKEYDPTCGKHSDVITLKRGGGVRRLSRGEVNYWEEHFSHLKASYKLLPLLSCSTPLTEGIYGDRLQRFLTTMKTLKREQKKMRISIADRRSQLERKLTAALRKDAAKSSKRSK